MNRFRWAFTYLIDDCGLLDAGTAMLDGSYWNDGSRYWEDGAAPDLRYSEPEIGGGE